MSKKKMMLILMLSLILVMSTFNVALAAGVNPGVNIGNWIQTNVSGLFAGIIAIVGVVLFMKRQLMGALVMVIFVGLGSIFIYNGTQFAQTIGDTIMEWFK